MTVGRASPPASGTLGPREAGGDARTTGANTRAGELFFARDSKVIAKRLLGCMLVRLVKGVRVAGIIVETEAYLGETDAASHAYKRRRTERTEPMYGKPGTAYVYFTYGMHWCMNVSCKAVDVPQAVLIRALEPVEGMEVMRRHRVGQVGNLAHADLCRGPARLCKALDIDRRHTGMDLCASEELWIEVGTPVSRARVTSSPRIGLNRGVCGDATDALLRYFVRGSVFVSGRQR